MKKQQTDEGAHLALHYGSIYEDEKLMSIGGRGHEIVALYRSFVRQYGKCDADKYYFCNRIKMPYSSFLKKVNELKQAGYLPADLFGITGVIKRPRKNSQTQNELNSNSNLTQVYLNSNSGLTQVENAMPLMCAPPKNNKNNKNNNAEGSPDGSLSENKINKTMQQDVAILQQGNSETGSDPDVISFGKHCKLELDYKKLELIYTASIKPEAKISKEAKANMLQVAKSIAKEKLKFIYMNRTNSGAYFYDLYKLL